jgi:hypothetical protein
MQQPIVKPHTNEVWCPGCADYVQILRISKAAIVADVSAKTIYTYVEEGRVHAMVVGKTLRVCVGSLIRINSAEPAPDEPKESRNGSGNSRTRKTGKSSTHEPLKSRAAAGIGNVPRK